MCRTRAACDILIHYRTTAATRSISATCKVHRQVNTVSIKYIIPRLTWAIPPRRPQRPLMHYASPFRQAAPFVDRCIFLEQNYHADTRSLWEGREQSYQWMPCIVLMSMVNNNNDWEFCTQHHRYRIASIASNYLGRLTITISLTRLDLEPVSETLIDFLFISSPTVGGEI